MKSPVKKCVNVVMFIMFIAAFQTGCSKLQQSTRDRDVLGAKQSKVWSKNPVDSADQYINPPHQALDENAPRDQARIVGISDESIDPNEKQIKLFANPAVPSLGGSRSANLFEEPCDHLASCDCYKRQLKPKLPHAEPIEPPPMLDVVRPTTYSSPETANPVIPTGIVNQPLAPILFDSETRQIQVNDTSNGTQNSLRRNDPWSYENPAEIEDKPATSSEFLENKKSTDIAIDTEPGLLRLNKTDDRVSSPMRTVDWRASNPSETTSFEPQARPTCDSCSSTFCDGSCTASNRRGQEGRLPTASRDPLINDATTLVDANPPFADCPPDDEINGVIEFEIDPPEFVMSTIDTEVIGKTKSSDDPVVDAISFDDLDDEQWAALWGPNHLNPSANQAAAPSSIPDVPCCSACLSSDCRDPKCEQQNTESDLAVDNPDHRSQPNAFPTFPVEVGSIVNKPDGAQLNEAWPFPAMPIEVTSETNSSEDVSSANHTTDISNLETAETLATRNSGFLSRNVDDIPTSIESFPAVIPTTSSTTDQEIESDLNSEFVPPANTGFNTTQSPTTITLPISSLPDANTTVFVPDGGSAPLLDLNSTTVTVDTIAETPPKKVEMDLMVAPQVQIALEADTKSAQVLDVNLQLLDVLIGKMADLEQRQHELSQSEKHDWQHQLDAIDLVVKSEGFSGLDSARCQTAKETLEALKKSVERLDSLGEFKVANGAFCTEITGFGQFKELLDTRFRGDQRLLIYCEVENYSSESRSPNFHTTLRGSFVIHNKQGRAVQQSQFATVEDVASTRRRDFYMYFPIKLRDLPPGEYKLDLQVEDTLSNQLDSLDSGLTFRIE